MSLYNDQWLLVTGMLLHVSGEGGADPVCRPNSGPGRCR